MAVFEERARTDWIRAPETSPVGIRRPLAADEPAFVAAMAASVEFHYPWVSAPVTPDLFRQYLKSRQQPTEDGFVIVERTSNDLAGVINLNVITRGPFQSAYLGYYAVAALAGRGYMAEGLRQVLDFAFNDLRLHRLEANIQPDNAASIALAERCGFRREGFSPAYLKIHGQWRDHERWAIVNAL